MSNAKLIPSRKWTGETVFKECKAQGLIPMFKGDVFIEYRDRQTGRRAVTGLPALNGVMGEEYTKALLEAETGKTEKLKPETIKKAQAKPPTLNKHDKLSKKIKLLVAGGHNPRKPGSKVWKSFEIYLLMHSRRKEQGFTVSEYLAIEGSGMNHLNWDIDCGYIELYD